MSDFLSMVKSTIDHHGVTIAQAYAPEDLAFVDVDDTIRMQQMLESLQGAIIWQMVTFEEAPADPLYTLIFGIGARTTQDPGRYGMMSMLGAVQQVFNVGEPVDIFDFSPGGDGVTKQGFMYVTNVAVDPQLDDKESGMRFVSVAAKVVRMV